MREKENKCECSHKYVKIHTVSVSGKLLNWEMSSVIKMMRGKQSKCSIHSSDQGISQTPFSVTWMYIPLSQAISFTSLTGETWKLEISIIRNVHFSSQTPYPIFVLTVTRNVIYLSIYVLICLLISLYLGISDNIFIHHVYELKRNLVASRSLY